MSTLPPPTGAPSRPLASGSQSAPPASPALPPPPAPGPIGTAAIGLPTLAAKPTMVISPRTMEDLHGSDAQASEPVVGRYVAQAPLASQATTPSGLVIRKSIAPMVTTAPQGVLMVATYLVVLAWMALTTTHFMSLDRFATRINDRDVRPGDEALAKTLDDRTVRYLLILGALFLVGMAATAWWSRRVAMNVESIGDRTTNVTLATFIWFIPVAWFLGGFRLMRRVPRTDWPSAVWQIPFVAPFVATYVVLRAFGIAARVDTQNTGDVRLGTLVAWAHVERILAFMFTGFTALAIIGAVYTVATVSGVFREIEGTRREAQAAA